MRSARVFLLACLFIGGLAGFSPFPQTSEASISVLDRRGERTDHIIDGNQIQLEITLPSPSPGMEKVNFALATNNEITGTCTLAAGARTCRTELFPALGWYWENGMAQAERVVVALDPFQKIMAQSESIAVAARPVVMVHGFVSSWETWKPYLGPDGFLGSNGLQGFAIGDGQAAGQLNAGNITNPPGRTNTIQQNAEILGQYIAGVKEKTGAEMVDLVAHSMGGMISRYYIDRVMKERDVAQLIMLGSPMGGSDCSVLPAALGFYLPASLEIRSSYMLGIFNRQITHRKGIHFYDLAGTAIVEPYQSPCAAVPNDTVVSVGSVNAIQLDSSQIKAIHSDLTISPGVFEQFVLPLLTNGPGSFAPAPDAEQASTQAAPLQFTRVYRGHVVPGGSAELTINIEADVSVASFALYDPTRSTAVSVRGASGKVIELDPQTNGFIRIEDPSSMVYLGYGFQNPKPGAWKVSVLATDATPAAGADFAISVYFVGGSELQAGSSTLIPRAGEPVKFTAQLLLGRQPMQILQGQAVVRHPDGKVETLELPAGTESSVDWRAGEPGVYGVDLVVTGQTPGGELIERTSFLTIEIQPNPSEGRVTANLAGLIGGMLLVVALVIFLFTRLGRALFRRRRRER